MYSNSDIFHAEKYKKALLLIKTVIFCYHGLEDEEKEILETLAEKMDARAELVWALNYVNEDVVSSYERCRKYLTEILESDSKEIKLAILHEAWKATNIKGYITEVEATAMLKLAKNWSIEREFISIIRNT